MKCENGCPGWEIILCQIEGIEGMFFVWNIERSAVTVVSFKCFLFEDVQCVPVEVIDCDIRYKKLIPCQS